MEFGHLVTGFQKGFLYKIALLGQATLDLHFMQEESDRENELLLTKERVQVSNDEKSHFDLLTAFSLKCNIILIKNETL